MEPYTHIIYLAEKAELIVYSPKPVTAFEHDGLIFLHTDEGEELFVLNKEYTLAVQLNVTVNKDWDALLKVDDEEEIN